MHSIRFNVGSLLTFNSTGPSPLLRIRAEFEDLPSKVDVSDDGRKSAKVLVSDALNLKLLVGQKVYR